MKMILFYYTTNLLKIQIMGIRFNQRNQKFLTIIIKILIILIKNLTMNIRFTLIILKYRHQFILHYKRSAQILLGNWLVSLWLEFDLLLIDKIHHVEVTLVIMSDIFVFPFEFLGILNEKSISSFIFLWNHILLFNHITFIGYQKIISFNIL